MIRHSTKSLTSAKWLGTVAGIAGALLIALNVGGTIVGIGFVFFAVSAASWVVAGWPHGRAVAQALTNPIRQVGGRRGNEHHR